MGDFTLVYLNNACATDHTLTSEKKVFETENSKFCSYEQMVIAKQGSLKGIHTFTFLFIRNTISLYLSHLCFLELGINFEHIIQKVCLQISLTF